MILQENSNNNNNKKSRGGYTCIGFLHNEEVLHSYETLHKPKWHKMKCFPHISKVHIIPLQFSKDLH